MKDINVVIAEDDFRIAQIHEEFLKKVNGMNLVGKALNATETLKLLNQYHVDLLLLDIYMPDRLGTDLLMEIREKCPNVDIIFITAAKEKEYINKALQFGAKQFLIKPITMEIFIETLECYKKNKEYFESLSEVNQDVVDKLFNTNKDKKTREELPAGIDYLTLEKVSKILKKEKRGLTAEKVGEMMGASRTTARRYLEYLVRIGEAYIEQAYGTVGRPERKYHINEG